MSRTKGTRVHPEWSEETVVAVNCDLCGRLSEMSQGWPVMNCYLDGMKDLFDICPPCWRDKVSPWLLEQRGKDLAT